MIGFLRGQVAALKADYCLLDVNGVGYRVFVAGSTRNKLRLKEETQLFTYMNVYQDGITLYGFASEDEYDIFQLLIGVSVGMLLALTLSFRFYGLVMVGFLLALLAQRFVFREAELKSEIVTGLILLLAVQLMAYTRPLPVVWYVGPVLLVGIICSRFLLFFIKLSRHCQRGTSQSTCFLGWESGLALGLGLGYALFSGDINGLLITSLIIAVVALLLYNYYVHKWFIQHKNR